MPAWSIVFVDTIARFTGKGWYVIGDADMLEKKLPTKLTTEPLLDAIFEARFVSTAPLSSILPGILFGRLEGDKTIERLPAADIPQQIRSSDPNLKFAPLVRLQCQHVAILVSDSSVAVACRMPYPGWATFKTLIIQTLEIIGASKLVQKVERYSLKYVDMLESMNLSEQIGLVNVAIVVGQHNLAAETFQVRIEIPEKTFINAVQILTNAVATLPDNTTKQGLIIDIDTVQNVNGLSLDELLSNFSDHLTELHQANKTMFFACLKDATIESLGPTYD